MDEVSRHFTGIAMEFTPTTGFQKKDEREKIKSWQLLGAASGLKGTIAQILLLSFALEVFAIAMPFFLQLTVDRQLMSGQALGAASGYMAVLVLALYINDERTTQAGVSSPGLTPARRGVIPRFHSVSVVLA